MLLHSATQESSALPESVKQVLDSQTFAKAPALRALLTYLWQNRDTAISEYAVATEALARSPAFDARTDATVRVQVSRLRQRLEKFYEKEGAASAYRVTIPLGTHQVTMDRALEAVTREPPVEVAAQQPRRAHFFAVCSAVLLLCCVLEGILLLRTRNVEGRAALEPLPWFWENYFSSGSPTRLVLPTPVFFSFKKLGGSDRATVMLRDTGVNAFANGENSEQYRVLTKSLGQPVLAENYTVTSDTFAAVHLVRYLDQFSRQTTLTSSVDAPLEALDRENAIAVGTWGTLTPLKSYLDRLSFRLGPHEEYVEFRNPAPGEPKRIDLVQESPERRIRPGIIGLVPGNGGRTHLLILASLNTSALVSVLTSSNGLGQLEQMWKSKGSPKYFDVVVNAEESGRNLVRAWPVALHPYKNKP
ncbi:MAG TPA: helix-turn-helix domain-containing protein [Bryobacteraceae bacterium]|jgi:hypothetical protein